MTKEDSYDIDELERSTSEEEHEPLSFWENKQRELLTSTVDYNLSGLYDLVQNSTVNLSPIYQRRDRWDDVRQSLLIESFLMNVPVPPIFLNEDEYGKYSVIDGRQRLTAIHSFISNNLALRGLQVFGDIDGLTFRQLPARFQAVIKTRPTLRAVIILRQSDPDIKYQVFRRLNTGGVTLNAQEIRNSVFPGSLNMEIAQLSEYKQFHNLLGIRSRWLGEMISTAGLDRWGREAGRRCSKAADSARQPWLGNAAHTCVGLGVREEDA